MDSTLACLAAWMPTQRWYASKGLQPRLVHVADVAIPLTSVGESPGADPALPAHDADPLARLLLVRDEAATPAVLYAVPVRVSDANEPPLAPIGRLDDESWLGDATHDADTMLALAELASTDAVIGALRSTPGSPDPSCVITGSRVLDGEQSNTSVILDASPAPLIAKVFRQVHPGINPDIELQSALSAAGCTRVPRVIGSIAATWTAREVAVDGSVLFVQEFLAGTEDAWRVALRAAATDDDFSAAAEELGRATAEVHAVLATALPSRDADATDRAAIAAAWRRRLEIATGEVPELRERTDAVAARYEAALDAPWPALQRIHGDYHLGQVLHSRERGWVLLDFEGEPMRPIAERRSLDLALRDVAGMLRSFDYAGASVQGDRAAADAWVSRAQTAFRHGYADASGIDLAAYGDVLTALELDKAVYEALYEARNRPDWTPIPVAAVVRLTD